MASLTLNLSGPLHPSLLTLMALLPALTLKMLTVSALGVSDEGPRLRGKVTGFPRKGAPNSPLLSLRPALFAATPLALAGVIYLTQALVASRIQGSTACVRPLGPEAPGRAGCPVPCLSAPWCLVSTFYKPAASPASPLLGRSALSHPLLPAIWEPTSSGKPSG